jgi:hypothetical protein
MDALDQKAQGRVAFLAKQRHTTRPKGSKIRPRLRDIEMEDFAGPRAVTTLVNSRGHTIVEPHDPSRRKAASRCSPVPRSVGNSAKTGCPACWPPSLCSRLNRQHHEGARREVLLDLAEEAAFLFRR